MPHSIFFHGSRLGGPASHGCIRLHPANAATLFALVKSEGTAATTIVVSGSNPALARNPAKSRTCREPAFARREKSYIGGTTPSLPNRTAPLSNVPSACFSVGTKTIAPGMMSLLSAGTNATIGTLAGMVIVFSPPL